MLAPHFTTTDVPRNSWTVADDSWLTPVVRRCATTHTAGIPVGLLTPQEHLIHDAVDEVMREICRRLGRMFRVAFDAEDSTWEDNQVDSVVDVMNTEVTALMDWLDWTSVWLKCRPECSEEVCGVTAACASGHMLTIEQEMCVVPTWPFGRDEDPDGTRAPRCVRLPHS